MGMTQKYGWKALLRMDKVILLGDTVSGDFAAKENEGEMICFFRFSAVF